MECLSGSYLVEFKLFIVVITKIKAARLRELSISFYLKNNFATCRWAKLPRFKCNLEFLSHFTVKNTWQRLRPVLIYMYMYNVMGMKL